MSKRHHAWGNVNARPTTPGQPELIVPAAESVASTVPSKPVQAEPLSGAKLIAKHWKYMFPPPKLFIFFSVGLPRVLLATIFLTSAFAQTLVNLGTQSRNVDFSTQTFTRPISVRTASPATCQIGQLFFNPSAAPGNNLFACTATNTWAQIGGSTYSFFAPLSASGNTVSLPQANNSTDGYLLHTDWSTFNAKQPAGNYLSALTGDITAAGPGSASAILATVNSVPGNCGDPTHVCQIITNGKGLVTSQSAVTISGGGISSVGLSLPSTLFSISGSPVTSTGTLTASYATGQTPNSAFGTDANGNVGFLSTLAVSGGVNTGIGTSNSGYALFSGAISGGAGWSVPNVAGTSILYLLPSNAGSAGQTLEDTGTTTCPTLPSGAPTTCHQTAWATVSGGGGGVNVQTASYTLASGDSGKLVTMNCSSCTAALPSSPPSSTWTTTIQNLNATALTVSRNGLQINGGTSNITLQPYQRTNCSTDNSNYFCSTPDVAGTNMTITGATNGQTLAGSGGGGLTTLSTPGSGWFQPFGRVAYAQAYNIGANNTYFFQFVCCGGFNLGIGTGALALSSGSASGHVAFALYADSSGAPSGSPLATSNTAAATAASDVFMSLTSQYAATNGMVYWLAISTDVAAGYYYDGYAANNYPLLNGLLNQSGHVRSFACTSGAGTTTWTSGTPTFPSTFCTSPIVPFPAMVFLP